jgi:hypothetical protein
MLHLPDFLIQVLSRMKDQVTGHSESRLTAAAAHEPGTIRLTIAARDLGSMF